MAIRSRSYKDELLKDLADDQVAAEYVTAAFHDTLKSFSLESFLMALRDVAQARQMAKVAKDAGVQRETLYRALSEQGNPTTETLIGVMTALGLRFDGVRPLNEVRNPEPSPGGEHTELRVQSPPDFIYPVGPLRLDTRGASFLDEDEITVTNKYSTLPYGSDETLYGQYIPVHVQ
jgi:probable addiction module antidote protein